MQIICIHYRYYKSIQLFQTIGIPDAAKQITKCSLFFSITNLSLSKQVYFATLENI